MTSHARADEQLVITDEYRSVFQLLQQPDRPNIFITGNAGTGKSTLLRHLVDDVCAKRSLAVVAPTGVAALNVEGATIHSFFRLPVKPMLFPEEDVQMRYDRRSMLKALDLLIIDEVSMVRADMLDCVDYALRLHRDRPDVPFGGVQVVVFGDLSQLPPVVTNDVERYLDAKYETPYFFSAHCLRDVPLTKIVLTQPFRQLADPRFLAILNRVRNNTVTLQDVNTLNTECRFDRPWPDVDTEVPIELTSTNIMADAINAEQLARLETPEFVYRAEISGQFDPKHYPTEARLVLRVGAQVMLLRNAVDRGYVNGSLGRVVHLGPRKIVVNVEGEDCEVLPVKWERLVYGLNGGQTLGTHATGTFKQYPIRLGWACTIHKAQGKSFDRVIVDFGRGAFAHGQAYVALSRCRTMAGLRLRNSMGMGDVLFDERILAYSTQFMSAGG